LHSGCIRGGIDRFLRAPYIAAHDDDLHPKRTSTPPYRHGAGAFSSVNAPRAAGHDRGASRTFPTAAAIPAIRPFLQGANAVSDRFMRRMNSRT